MNAMTALLKLLTIAGLVLIFVHQNCPDPDRQSCVPTVNPEKTSGDQAKTGETEQATQEESSKKEEEVPYKSELDEADRFLGEAALYLSKAMKEPENRAEYSEKALDATDEVLNIIDWLDRVYPDHQDIEERRGETVKIRAAALRIKIYKPR